MNPRRTHWSDLVTPATLERFVYLVRETRRLGRRPRVLLLADERSRLDLVEAELDQLVEQLRPAVAAAGTPALIADTVELVRDTRGLQRYYRRTQCPAVRRDLPAIEAQVDEKVDQLDDVVGVFALTPAVAEGGAP